MMRLASQEGMLIRQLAGSGVYGFQDRFGFISAASREDRQRMRVRAGLKPGAEAWRFTFEVRESGNGMEVLNPRNCTATKQGAEWRLITPVGEFRISQSAELDPKRVDTEAIDERTLSPWWGLLAMLPILALWFSPSAESPVVEVAEEPVAVRVAEPTKNTVAVPQFEVHSDMTQLASKTQNNLKKGGAMVAQNLGFLSLIGKKDLKKALGGMPIQAKQVTPGAGAGGSQGSGGELLVGLGQGVKQTTVGNSGVVGLGGVGVKGPGGGGGGAGNSWLGSGGTGNVLQGVGDGRRLSQMTAAEEIYLEGGLERAVIQATIAKYLSEIRACYEVGLRKVPGLNGTVSMFFEITGSGSVGTSRVAKSSLGNEEVEHCMSDRLRTWKFPEPRGGVAVRVTYPFLLRPVG